MRYLGGKQQIGRYIGPIISQHDPRCVYLEPFMGSCWVTSQVHLPNRVAGDLHEEVVALYDELCRGWDPPASLSREEFEDIRAHRGTDKYPKALTAFACFGCAFAGSYGRGYAGPQYAKFTRNSLLRKRPRLIGTRFYAADYRVLTPRGCVIYCDPPYAKASYGYRITGVRGNGHFDHDEFWDIVARWSQDNVVYVSEYEAPAPFEGVWERRSSVQTRQHRKAVSAEYRLERLFRAGEDKSLLPDQPIHEALGVPPDWPRFR